MTGIILSGGKNVRMGTNKAFIEIDGERLIDRTIRLFKNIFDEVILVTNSPLEYLDQDVKIVTDIIKEKGAIGGIYTGLFYSTCDHSFVSACDMPFLNRSFIEYMIANTRHYDIVIPSPPDGLQPLHAIYSSRCLPHIKKSIDTDKLKITGFFKSLKVLKIPDDIITTFGPERMMFSNINTKEDLTWILQ